MKFQNQQSQRLRRFTLSSLIASIFLVGIASKTFAQEGDTSIVPTIPETTIEATPIVPEPQTPSADPGTNSIQLPESSPSDVTQPFDEANNLGSSNSTTRSTNLGQNRSFGDLANSVMNNSPFASSPSQGYNAQSTTTGTIFSIPSIANPATVDTVTRQTLLDQQVVDFDEAFRNVAGATRVGDGLFPDRLFLRGLEVQARDFRKNGFLDPTYTPRDFANIERVEILKGPSSVMYGSSSPAGTVNFNTKKPIDAEFAEYNYQFGDFELNRHQIDVNGHVNESGSLLYRFNASYEDSNSFRDFGFTERYLLAPSVRWIIDSDTMLTWEAEIIDNDRRADTGTVALNGNALALPPERFVGDPVISFIQKITEPVLCWIIT